jgi:CHAT domain-containing protein/tetratricopeptide (TPR) repeat protein
MSGEPSAGLRAAHSGIASLTVVAALGGSVPSFAATFDQIVAACKESVGKPIVQSCMKAHGRGGNLEACRAKATPAVRGCVTREMSKAAASKPAPAAPVVKETPAEGIAEVAPTIYVAPPRTIADITAILDQEKPDPFRIAKIKANADAEPPKGGSPTAFAQFYYDRGNARALLGRNREALADGEKALEVGKGTIEFRQVIRIRQFVGGQLNALGDPRKAMQTFQITVREGNQPGQRGSLINAQRNVATTLVLMGDVGQAEAYIRRNASLVQDARGSPHPNWRNAYAVYGRSWEADADEGRALIFEARGQFKEAEAAYARGEAFRRASLKDLDKLDYPPPRGQILTAANNDVAGLARVKARQGRLSEAEVDARRGLLAALKNHGKYHPGTARFIVGLATVLVEQGRYAEAEQLTRAAIDIQRTLGIGDDTQSSAQILSQLGGILNLQGKSGEAATVYAELDKAIAKWEPQRRQVLELNGSRIYSLYASGRIEEGIAAAQALLAREINRVGEKHFDTAAARGTLALGYMRAGRGPDALREFRAAIPILMAASRENADDDDVTVVAARAEQLQSIVEAYIRLVAKASQDAGRDIAAETFSLADAIRGRSVQQALTSSSARMVAKDAALADLVRKEQDLTKQINAQLGSLNNVLALPSGARDPGTIKAINASIDKYRAERAKAQQEIARRFPAYDDLIDPKPPTVDQIRATLAPGEAFVSFYFGREASFVWAIPKVGAIAFASVPATGGELEAMIRKLRAALEPQAAMVSDIPAFDVALGYELYSLLLKPVERGWKSASSLIVVTNGALGLLPLSLLPTAPPAEIAAADDPLFARYRNVPWLARTHAVSMVPSAAALRTLRQLPPGRPSRSGLIAFGDPYFSEEQAQEAAATEGVEITDASSVTRGVPLKRRNSPKLEGVDSAELALLPRLPDTADELKAIAVALQADPSEVLNLGKEANEAKVKSLDLSGFKVVAFATHGLVAGELNGLTQPALALSAPSVVGSAGDGLLTMEEILALKLDADWVVLSACNTGAGAGAGAEAASGLGRAFFYAGTRALLLTNWSVHSQSARELVSDMFERQASDPSLTRAEALRQAMLKLIDGKGYADEQGKTQFAYAHPLFWAPYTIIGDGGRR